MIFGIVCILGIILLAVTVLHAAVVMLLPIAVAVAIYIFIRYAISCCGEDPRILDGSIGAALFIIILWLVI